MPCRWCGGPLMSDTARRTGFCCAGCVRAAAQQHNPFKVGDIVRLRGGWTAMKVVRVRGPEVAAVYSPSHAASLERSGEVQHLSASEFSQVRDASEFCKWTRAFEETDSRAQSRFKREFDEIQKEKTMTNALFRFVEDEKEFFCTKLAQASGKRTVVEVKGTGEVKTVADDALTEVLPYTVGIKFLNGHNTSTVYHYFDADQKLKENNLLLHAESHNFAMVTKLDTKSKRADKEFEGWVVSAEYIKAAQ